MSAHRSIREGDSFEADRSQPPMPVGSLGLAPPPAGAGSRADDLCQTAHAGDLVEAFDELAAADWNTMGERPLLVKVRDAVAHKLTMQAAEPFLPLLPAALHTLSITPMTASTMVLDEDGAIHLVRSRDPDDDAMGELLHTACGQELWSDIELPMRAALRGCWQEPEDGTSHCDGCTVHANEFPETSERHDGPEMPAARSYVLAAAVAAETRTEVLEHLEHLRHIEPSAAHNSVSESYREWLLEGLAVGAENGGNDAVKDILLRYHDKAAAELRSVKSPYADDLAGLMTREDWRAVITNVIDDLQESEDGAAARTYLYTELRAIVAEKVRRIRAEARGEAGAR